MAGALSLRTWLGRYAHVLANVLHAEFFLTARSLYLLVLGEREDLAERDAAYWLQLICGYAGSAPVVGMTSSFTIGCVRSRGD
jgi:hypothetical protein